MILISFFSGNSATSVSKVITPTSSATASSTSNVVTTKIINSTLQQNKQNATQHDNNSINNANNSGNSLLLEPQSRSIHQEIHSSNKPLLTINEDKSPDSGLPSPVKQKSPTTEQTTSQNPEQTKVSMNNTELSNHASENKTGGNAYFVSTRKNYCALHCQTAS